MTEAVTPLPEPDLTMPSITPDGPEGAHFYRAGTVRAILAVGQASRAMFVSRLEHEHGPMNAQDALALLNDCDMLAARPQENSID